ncbi:MAG TPA: glycosyltransferase family 39 protein, partial [Chthonomonadales bacterium]|nr:glycosyltransferase family 39 protein [Chthonomonadales bacterium]
MPQRPVAADRPLPPSKRLQAPAARRWLFVSPCLLLALITVIFLYRSPHSASDLEIVPDSVEYALAARRFALQCSYSIEINHSEFPPRYPPGFSVAALAPAYLLLPESLGAGILAVLAFAVVGALAAYGIGRRLSGTWGGFAAGLCLAAYKGYAAMSRLIMSDVPLAALFLVGCLLYMRMRTRTRPLDYVLAGLLTAYAFAIRTEGLVLLLPFALLWLRDRRKPATGWFGLLAPTAIVIGATLAYNHAVFGQWMRTGYQFWCAVPYDYPGLVMSVHYLPANLRLLFAWPEGKQCLFAFAAGAIGIALLMRRSARRALPPLRFAALTALPVSIAHLFYFYPAYRFHLPLFSFCLICFGAGIAAFVPRAIRSGKSLAAIAGAAACGALLLRPAERPTPRLRAAIAIARVTPRNSLILTNIDAVYMYPIVLGHTGRSVLPLTRDAEYASKCISLHRAPHPIPAPSSPLDHRCAGLLRAGAREVFPYVLVEAPQRVAEIASGGRPVFIDLSAAPPGFPDQEVSRWLKLVP